jgi:hypothetical protein
MRFPRRPAKNIQPIPSILTAFPASHDRPSGTPANESPDSVIEEGIEVVPIERSNTPCGKIVSPGDEEKELVARTPLEIYIAAKPLPNLPHLKRGSILKSRWSRLPVNHRVFILVAIQVILVLALFAGLMSIKGSSLNKYVIPCIDMLILIIFIRKHSSTVQANDVESPSWTDSPPITNGTYSLALGNARQQSSGCLATNNESITWACTDGRSLKIDISTSSARTLISLGSLRSSNQSMYGQQAPEVAPTELHPAVNTDSEGHKPLYSFRTTYSRTVLLPTTQQRQAKEASGPTLDVDGTVIQSNEKPWLCFFNETIIEGFIYAPDNLTVLAPANMSDTSQIPRFPYVLMLSEERFPNGTLPYCERMTMSEHGELVPDGTSRQYLSFSEPTFLLAEAGGYSTSSSRHRRQQTPITNSCRCEWICEHSNW